MQLVSAQEEVTAWVGSSPSLLTERAGKLDASRLGLVLGGIDVVLGR